MYVVRIRNKISLRMFAKLRQRLGSCWFCALSRPPPDEKCMLVCVNGPVFACNYFACDDRLVAVRLITVDPFIPAKRILSGHIRGMVRTTKLQHDAELSLKNQTCIVWFHFNSSTPSVSSCWRASDEARGVVDVNCVAGEGGAPVWRMTLRFGPMPSLS